MLKKMKKVVALFAILLIVGCAPTLPEVSKIDKNYSSLNVRTFSVKIDCSNATYSDIPANFIENYCQILEGNIKLSLQNENPYWKYNEKSPDLVVETILEQIHGGSASARFWIGFGAGRTVTTTYIKVLKHDKIIAERRFNETTTLTNLATNNWSNEDAITQDAPLIARKIAKFIQNPDNYETQNSTKNKTSEF